MVGLWIMNNKFLTGNTRESGFCVMEGRPDDCGFVRSGKHSIKDSEIRIAPEVLVGW